MDTRVKFEPKNARLHCYDKEYAGAITRPIRATKVLYA